MFAFCTHKYQARSIKRMDSSGAGFRVIPSTPRVADASGSMQSNTSSNKDSDGSVSRNPITSVKGDILTGEVEGKIYPPSSKRRSKMSALKCFGVDLSPDNLAVAIVYFVQGVLGLARLAVSFYLKDELHLNPAETAVISGVSSLPWLVKPLYGFISDSIPLFGYRRRSYLILSGLLGALSWSLMATLVDSKLSAAFCILLGSLSVAFSDVDSVTHKIIPQI